MVRWRPATARRSRRDMPRSVADREADSTSRTPSVGELRGVAFGGPGAAFCGFHLAVLWWGVGYEVVEQLRRGRRDGVHGALEGLGVGPRGLRVAADFADVLQRGVANLLLGGRRLEVVERADIATHAAEDSYSGSGRRGISPRSVTPWRVIGLSRTSSSPRRTTGPSSKRWLRPCPTTVTEVRSMNS